MSRAIKFRAWDGTTLTPWEWLDKHVNCVWTALNAQRFDNNNMPSDSYPLLMQYTGLKDKNDVEIYEGDIIELAKGAEADLAKVQWCQKNCRYIAVLYNNKEWSYKLRKDNAKLARVIGNVYENPERR